MSSALVGDRVRRAPRSRTSCELRTADLEASSRSACHADYRRRVAVALAARALADAIADATRRNGSVAMKVSLNVNGRAREADVEPRKTLLDACARISG